MSRGYLNRPELTAERFVEVELFGRVERMYRTGDLARWRGDGQLEYLGRLDHQVKLRGFRIELGEIEATLARHATVREAVVVVRGEGEQRRLAAYVTVNEAAGDDALDGGARIEALRAYLGAELPEYMVPGRFVELAHLPRTPSGKLDRAALPEPQWVSAGSGQPARDDTDELLLGLWSQVLGERIEDIEADFFALGGHSLLATQLASRLRERFAVEVPLRVLFEHATVRSQADWLSRQRRAAAPTPLVRQDPGEPKVLSYAQQRLWFLAQLEGPAATYNVPVALGVDGPLDRAALRESLRALVGRHQSLRLIFPAVDGQATLGELEVYDALHIVDLGGLAESVRQARLEAEVAAHGGAPFDLAAGPLFRVRLMVCGPGRHVLLMTLHHIVSDGWSMGVLVREWGELYQAVCAGRAPALSSLAIDYSDYAAWQRGWLVGEVLERQLAYWRAQLAEAPALLELPTDRPRLAVRSYRGAHLERTLDEVLTGRIEALARSEGVTLYMTLLGAFAVLLARHSGHDDIVVGSPIANRTQVATEGLIGLFVNTLVLRGRIDPEAPFSDLLAETRKTCLDAYAYQDIPFEQLVEQLNPERSLSHSPLFQAMFVLQNAPLEELELPGLTLQCRNVTLSVSNRNNEGTCCNTLTECLLISSIKSSIAMGPPGLVRTRVAPTINGA